MAGISLLWVSGAANAQWTDGGWTPTVINRSSSGYTYNGTSPGATAVAPSGGSYHNYIYLSYSDTMSSNGVNYDTSIAWQYYLYGHVVMSTSCSSQCSWPTTGASASDGLSGGGTYEVGPTWESGLDTPVARPGATITVYINVDATASTYPSTSSSTATATLNGQYTP